MIITNQILKYIAMTEFISLPVQTQIAVILGISILVVMFIRMLFNLGAYIWAVYAMERQKRIDFLTRSKLRDLFIKEK